MTMQLVAALLNLNAKHSKQPFELIERVELDDHLSAPLCAARMQLHFRPQALAETLLQIGDVR
jgi:hypothetical protein